MKTLALALIMIGVAAAVVEGATKKQQVRFDAKLPVLGTKFHSLPAGTGKVLVEGGCLQCHSADMLVQQRLTEKQWTATVDKMVRWGASVKEADKPAVVAYLSKHFGPENTFKPIVTRPSGH